MLFVCAYIAKKKSFATMNYAPGIYSMPSAVELPPSLTLIGSLFQLIRPYFLWKLPKWNKITQPIYMVMNVSGTVCQLILYFPGKQGLYIAIWHDQLSKINNAHAMHFLTTDDISVDSHLLVFGAITKYIIIKINSPLGWWILYWCFWGNAWNNL